MTNPISAQLVAIVERDLEQMRKRDEAVQLAPLSRRRTNGSSTVYSLRLTPAEVTALQARAALIGVRPTVLARNLIRSGLTARYGAELAASVDRLEAALSEVRAHIT